MDVKFQPLCIGATRGWKGISTIYIPIFPVPFHFPRDAFTRLQIVVLQQLQISACDLSNLHQ